MEQVAAFVLFAVLTPGLPDLAPLASFRDKGACEIAAVKVRDALMTALPEASGTRVIVCISEEALSEMGSRFPPPSPSASG